MCTHKVGPPPLAQAAGKGRLQRPQLGLLLLTLLSVDAERGDGSEHAEQPRAPMKPAAGDVLPPRFLLLPPRLLELALPRPPRHRLPLLLELELALPTFQFALLVLALALGLQPVGPASRQGRQVLCRPPKAHTHRRTHPTPSQPALEGCAWRGPERNGQPGLPASPIPALPLSAPHAPLFRQCTPTLALPLFLDRTQARHDRVGKLCEALSVRPHTSAAPVKSDSVPHHPAGRPEHPPQPPIPQPPFCAVADPQHTARKDSPNALRSVSVARAMSASQSASVVQHADHWSSRVSMYRRGPPKYQYRALLRSRPTSSPRCSALPPHSKPPDVSTSRCRHGRVGDRPKNGPGRRGPRRSGAGPWATRPRPCRSRGAAAGSVDVHDTDAMEGAHGERGPNGRCLHRARSPRALLATGRSWKLASTSGTIGKSAPWSSAWARSRTSRSHVIKLLRGSRNGWAYELERGRPWQARWHGKQEGTRCATWLWRRAGRRAGGAPGQHRPAHAWPTPRWPTAPFESPVSPPPQARADVRPGRPRPQCVRPASTDLGRPRPPERQRAAVRPQVQVDRRELPQRRKQRRRLCTHAIPLPMCVCAYVRESPRPRRPFSFASRPSSLGPLPSVFQCSSSRASASLERARPPRPARPLPSLAAAPDAAPDGAGGGVATTSDSTSTVVAAVAAAAAA